jgi:peptidoglycan/LPS O-acetylase OafA/YrhL
MTERTQGRIRELDGWRGISILLVLSQHLVIYAFPSLSQRSKLIYHLFGVAGGFGVRIFFTISGFVITRQLCLEEAERGKISLKGFYTRRLFRILPVFYCVLATIAVFSWLRWTPTPAGTIVTAALFLKDLKSPTLDWFVGHSWSLAVEEQFYLVFPLLWVLIPKHRRPVAFLIVLAAFIAWSICTSWHSLADLLNPAAILGFCCICAGALIAVLYEPICGFVVRVPSWIVWPIALFLLTRPYPDGPASESFYSLAVPFGVGLMLMHPILVRSPVTALLNSPLLQKIGMISYSAYLWQQIFTASSDLYGSPAVSRIFHLGILLLPLIAYASYRFIEKPTMRIGRRMSTKWVARENVTA